MNPNAHISLGQAFAHCACTGSYWLWLAIAIIICGATIYFAIKSLKTSDIGAEHIILLFALLAIMALAVFLRPTEVCQNTSVSEAARGIYIGY
jgi:hypothetical protein